MVAARDFDDDFLLRRLFSQLTFLRPGHTRCQPIPLMSDVAAIPHARF